MYHKRKFNIRLLLCVVACTMCWSIAFADSADNGNVTPHISIGMGSI